MALKPTASLLGPTKADVGLSNVDNTSDANKPISAAAAAALAYAEPLKFGQPYTVYLNYGDGDDSNVGNSPGKPLLTLAEAFRRLNSTARGGKIIMLGLANGETAPTAPLHAVQAIQIEGHPTHASQIRRNFSTPNSRAVWDAVTTAGGGSVQSATAAFTGADVGRILSIYGAGTGGGTFYDFVSGVPDGTHATLTATTAVARSATTDPNGVKMTVAGDWGRVVTDATISAGSLSVVSSPTAAWTAADVGTELVIQGAGANGQALRSAIASVSGNNATILGVASNAVVGVRCAIGVNFGDLINFHVAGCGIRQANIIDTSIGAGRIGAAVRLQVDQGGPITGVASFQDVSISSSDAAGAWEHIVDVDGSWGQGGGGPGLRQVAWRNIKLFGARRPTETIRIVNGVHHWFTGGGIVGAAPTTFAQGIALLDPQKTAGVQVATVDIHFTGCEALGSYLSCEGQYCSFVGGRIGSSTVVGSRASIALASVSDHCLVATINADTRAGSATDAGTNNQIITNNIVAGGVLATLDANGHLVQKAPSAEHTLRNGATPTLRESFMRHSGVSATKTTTVSGVMLMAAVPVFKGDLIGHIITALSVGPTWGTNADGHWWVAIYDSTKTLVLQSADQLQGTAGGQFVTSGTPSVSLGSQWTVPANQIAYAALMINIGTGGAPVMPTIVSAGVAVMGSIALGTAQLAGSNGAALTTTAPAGPVTITTAANGLLPWFGLYP